MTVNEFGVPMRDLDSFLKPISRSLLAAVCAGLMAVIGVAPPSLAGPAEDLEKYLRSIKTLTARFEQRVTDSKGAIVERSKGTFALSRPGKFRWDYLEPYEQLIVSNGSELWMYDADLAQVTVHSARDTLRSTPAELLSSNKPISQSFVLRAGPKRDGLQWVLLKPRTGDSGYQQIRVGMRNGRLARMELSDALGQLTRLSFSSLLSNPKLASSIFNYKAPSGVDVVDNRKR